MADQRIQYNEKMVGASHPTFADTLNRLALVEHNNDGTHNRLTQVTDPWVDVRAYGAVGDGVTDDSTAIQNAIDNNKYIFIPPGLDFHIGTTGLTITADETVLFGAGRQSKITYAGTGTALSVGTAGSGLMDVSVHGLYITAANAAKVMYVTGARRSEFYDLVLNDATTGIGLHAYAETGSGIYRTSFRDIYSSGCLYPFKIEGDGDAIGSPRINACTFENLVAPSILASGTGFDISSASGNAFIGCDAESSADNVTGFKFSACQRVAVVGGWCEINGSNPVHVNMTGQTNNHGVVFVGFRYGSTNTDLDTLDVTNVIRKIARDSTTRALTCELDGDTGIRFEILPSGKVQWGDGTNPVDTNLYRRSANNLKTDDNLIVGGNATIAGTTAIQNTTAKLYAGTGSPEGSVTATIGSLYLRTDGGASTTLYVKESGSGNTGWVAK